MDFRKKSRILTVFVIIFMSGIQGQFEDFMKICDLCHRASLQDCNSTNIFAINMTINCEMTNKICTLGINEDFEGFEDKNLHKIDEQHICVFKDLCKDNPENSSINIDDGRVEVMENKELTEEEYISSAFISNQVDENSSEIIEQGNDNSTILAILTTPNFESTTENTVLDESLIMQNDEPVEHKQDQNVLAKSALPPDPPPIEAFSCFVCESLSNEACMGRIDELNTTDCLRGVGCVSYHLDGNIVRKCASEISPLEADLCRKPTNQTCDLCQSAACNKKLWKECFKCNSNNDPNCALWSDAEKVPFAVCPNYNDNCLVRITKEGHTLRECAQPNVKCSQDELCQVCEGPLCNAGVFPPDRLQCIQCQECEDAQNPENALPCLNYNANEKCYLYVTAKSKMIRGCLSNQTAMEECQNNGPKCMTCDKPNGCNSVPLMKEPTLSCSKCKSKNNPSCVWKQPESSITKCVRKYLFYLKETCLSQYDPSTEEAVRDCSMDYGVCTPEDVDCKSCSENGCNRDSLKEQQCFKCQSDQPEQAECRNQAVGIQPSKCAKENQTFDNRGCYTLTKGNVISRGCVVDLSTDDMKLCKKKSKTSCDICVKDLCNNILAPSVGSKSMSISIFVLICIVLIHI